MIAPNGPKYSDFVEMNAHKEAKAVERLRDNAERCRRLARQVSDREVAAKLNDLARELEAKADAEEQKS